MKIKKEKIFTQKVHKTPILLNFRSTNTDLYFTVFHKKFVKYFTKFLWTTVINYKWSSRLKKRIFSTTSVKKRTCVYVYFSITCYVCHRLWIHTYSQPKFIEEHMRFLFFILKNSIDLLFSSNVSPPFFVSSFNIKNL